MVSQVGFFALVVIVAIQRSLELRVSRRNELSLRRRGGVEHAPHQLRWMALLHVAWLGSMVVEVFAFDRPFLWWLALPALAVFGIGQSLRYAAIRSLGWRWTVRIITVRNEVPVSDGVFRYIRHPNYLGVIIEIAALPLVHSAWITALGFSLLNGIVLRHRIVAEEQALAEAGDYAQRFRNRPRPWPRA